MRKTKYAIALAGLLSIGAVQASDCNEPAPGYDSNAYFDLIAASNTIPTETQTQEFTKRLTGNWRGTQLEMNCKGHYKSPHKDYDQYHVRAEISQHFSGAIRIEAEKERQSDRTVKLEKLFFSTVFSDKKSVKNYATDKSEPHSNFFEFIDDNTLILVEKFRVHNGGVSSPATGIATGTGFTSRMLHEIKKITLEKNTLKIDRKLYVNGLFVAQDGWTLERG